MYCMPGSEDTHTRSVHVMAPHRWRSAHILEAVCQVNEHLVSVLSELARRGDTSNSIVAHNVDDLRRLDAALCKRAARIPVLLLDLHFQDEGWWRHAALLNEAGRASTASASSLPDDCTADLSRESLIVAWLAVHHAPKSVSLLFGMSNAVAGLLSELTPQQLNRVAERSNHELRIRWQTKPDFWRRMLVAVRSDDADGLCEIHLLGLQLLGGELMRAR